MPNEYTCWASIGILWTWSGLSCSRSFTSSDVDLERNSMDSNPRFSANKVIQVPASTGWPLVAAFGFTLVFAGLLTHVMVSTLGAVTLCMGLVGWFRQVL